MEKARVDYRRWREWLVVDQGAPVQLGFSPDHWLSMKKFWAAH